MNENIQAYVDFKKNTTRLLKCFFSDIEISDVREYKAFLEEEDLFEDFFGDWLAWKIYHSEITEKEMDDLLEELEKKNDFEKLNYKYYRTKVKNLIGNIPYEFLNSNEFDETFSFYASNIMSSSYSKNWKEKELQAYINRMWIEERQVCYALSTFLSAMAHFTKNQKYEDISDDYMSRARLINEDNLKKSKLFPYRNRLDED